MVISQAHQPGIREKHDRIYHVNNFMKALDKESDEIPDCVVDFLMWHHFGKRSNNYENGSIIFYKHHFKKEVNPANFQRLLKSWEERSELGISRDKGPLQLQVLNIIGDCSPYLEVIEVFLSTIVIAVNRPT